MTEHQPTCDFECEGPAYVLVHDVDNDAGMSMHACDDHTYAAIRAVTDSAPGARACVTAIEARPARGTT